MKRWLMWICATETDLHAVSCALERRARPDDDLVDAREGLQLGAKTGVALRLGTLHA